VTFAGQVLAAERVLLQRDVLVRPQVGDPHHRRPRRLARRLAVEEENVRLHALRIEDPGREAQECMDVALVQELAADRFARTALEQDAVRDDDGAPAARRNERLDVLEEAELLVRRRRPEVVTHHDEVRALRFTRRVHERHRRLAAERRVVSTRTRPLAAAHAARGHSRSIERVRTASTNGPGSRQAFDAAEVPDVARRLFRAADIPACQHERSVDTNLKRLV
jgi:hypothetical protein